MTRRGAAVAASAVLAVLPLLAGVLGAAPATAAPATAPAAAQPAQATHPTVDPVDAGSPLDVRVLDVAPVVLGPAGTLTVSGTVTNRGSSAVQTPTVRLRVRQRVLEDRAEVATWAAGALPGDGPSAPPVRLATLAPGARASFTVSVPARRLGLGATGPRGVSVTVSGDAGQGLQELGGDRSYVAWQPGVKEYAAQPVTFLVPLTGVPDPGEDGTLDALEAAQAVGPGSRLRALVDAPWPASVAWAVDPALLEALETAAGGPAAPAPGTSAAAPGAAPTPETRDEPAEDPGADPVTPEQAAARTTVRGFLADLRARAVSRAVVELPYADPDLAAVVGAGRADLLDPARAEASDTVTRVLGTTPVDDVAWPADGWADSGTLAALAARGQRTVVLDASTRPLRNPTPYTPAARASLGRGTTGLLYDPVLSTVLADTRTGGDASGAVQRLLAETFAATMVRPGESRHLLVVAPREWTPDPAAVGRLLTAVAQAPWLGSQPLSELRASPDRATTDDPRAASAALPSVRAAQLPADDVRDVGDLRARLAPVAAVTGDPEVTRPTARAALTLLSAQWRGAPSERARAAARVSADVERLQNGVKVLPSRVTFLASDGVVQVTVQNDLPVPVRNVGLRVRSDNPRLVVTRFPERVDVEAGRRATVQVPVRALAGGLVALSAQVVAADGSAVGTPVAVQLRVSPTDTWALWVLGGLAGVVLVAGLVRALRRPRRRPTAPVLDDPALPDTPATGDDGAPGATTSGAAPGRSRSRGPGPDSQPLEETVR